MAPGDADDEMAEIRNDFLVEAQEMIEGLDQQFVKLEADPSDTGLVNEIFRSMHSMKGSAGFLGFTHLVEVAHRAESVLNKVRQGEIQVSGDIITVILEAVDVVKALVSDIRETGTDQHVETQGISEKLDVLLESPAVAAALASVDEPAPVPQAVAAPAPVPIAPPVQAGKPAAAPASKPASSASAEAGDGKGVKGGKGGEEDQTIRVETRRLDTVMNLVGELVLCRNRMMKIGSGLERAHEGDPLGRELGETLAQLSLVSSDLQLAVMKTRMVPIKKVMARFPRMVRDLAQKLGKQVRLDLQGEDTELDKSVADEIGDPLVHLVRNSIDHGIEPPVVRMESGKPPDGTVRISASQEGNSIVIRISDDGAGLRLDRIKAKALSKGLVSEGELSSMDERGVMNLIFHPGFSTAEQVTDVSGRGVGMDVVRTNIRRLNGSVEVSSEQGKGSMITIKLPLTIAIIQALAVGVEQQLFAIPLVSVIEAVKISKRDIKTVDGRPVMNLRDRVLPLLRLCDEFEVITPSGVANEGYVVVVASGERRLGLVVDRLQAQEEIVIKSMGDFLGDIKGVAGATITGDGKVILILDINEFVHSARYDRMSYAGAAV
ncbi:MAG: chemotaxis protein CheA [Nitrospirae bacterium]|nr:chemotaxis protein CheA [Nitrospirota bacterium]